VNAGYPEYQTFDDVSIDVFEGEYRATPRPWLVRRLIRKIHRGGSIWGLPGQGKGVAVMFLIIAMLNGLEIGGRAVERVKKVLYVDAEDDEREFANRVVATCAGWSTLLGAPVPVPTVDQLVYMNVGVNFQAPAQSARFREAIIEVGADVVIYDAIQSTFSGDQNSGQVGGGVWEWIKRTAVDGDHVPLAIDHSGWQGRHEAGTVQKRGRVGQSIQVSLRPGSARVHDDGSEEQIIDLYLRKSNYQVSPGEETPVLSLRTTFTRSPDLIEGAHDPEDAMGPTLIEFVEAPEPEKGAIGLVIEMLEEHGEMTETEIGKRLNRSAEAVRKMISRDQAKGGVANQIRSARNPKRYFLDAEG
jgi:hypothetical protein